MIRIGVCCPDFYDATCFYRGWGPMARIPKLYDSLSVEIIREANWWSIKMLDIVFIQRPFNSQHQMLAMQAKTSGKKLWVDYDDDLMNLPKENEASFVYSNPETQKIIQEICTNADVVTVATPPLKELFGKYNANTKVVRNVLDDEVCKRSYPAPSQNEKFILWRGTTTHERDVNTIHDALIELSHEELFSDWKWFFFGMYPFRTMDAMKSGRAYFGKGTDILRYFNVIYAMQPEIMIVPLSETHLNISKSNIAWMEATWAGASVLSQRLPEWDRPGMENFSDQAEFKEKLRMLVTARNAGCKLHNEESWNYILQNLTLKNASKERYEIVRELMA